MRFNGPSRHPHSKAINTWKPAMVAPPTTQVHLTRAVWLTIQAISGVG